MKQGVLRLTSMAFVALQLLGSGVARAEVEAQDIYVTADDGVVTKLHHLSNPGKPIVLLEPSLATQDTVFSVLANAFRLRGDYDVFVGNPRGAARLPDGMKLLGEHNGLTELARKDLPSQLRYIRDHYATPEQRAAGITLVGHSMGGMSIMGALSDAALLAEFKPAIKSIVLFASPHEVRELRLGAKLLSMTGAPALRQLKQLGLQSIDLHPAVLDSGNRIVSDVAYRLVRHLLAPAYSDKQTLKELLPKMSAYALPLDVLLDFADAVNRGGEIRDASGAPLIKPELITDIPILMIRGRLDSLAPWHEQERYFTALATQRKQLLSVEDMNHLDSVLATAPAADFMPHVLMFMADPATSLREGPRIDFDPTCESLLTKPQLKFRHRGL